MEGCRTGCSRTLASRGSTTRSAKADFGHRQGSQPASRSRGSTRSAHRLTTLAASGKGAQTAVGGHEDVRQVLRDAGYRFRVTLLLPGSVIR